MGRGAGLRVMRWAALLVVALLAALPATASAKPIQKKVGATLLFQDATRPTDGNNCGTQVVLQWKDPTANRFVGSSWVGHYFVTTRGVARGRVWVGVCERSGWGCEVGMRRFRFSKA